MRHFEMQNIMGNYLWYENIDGEWTLVMDRGYDVYYDGVSMGCKVGAHSFGNKETTTNETLRGSE